MASLGILETKWLEVHFNGLILDKQGQWRGRAINNVGPENKHLKDYIIICFIILQWVS